MLRIQTKGFTSEILSLPIFWLDKKNERKEKKEKEGEEERRGRKEKKKDKIGDL